MRQKVKKQRAAEALQSAAKQIKQKKRKPRVKKGAARCGMRIVKGQKPFHGISFSKRILFEYDTRFLPKMQEARRIDFFSKI